MSRTLVPLRALCMPNTMCVVLSCVCVCARTCVRRHTHLYHMPTVFMECRRGSWISGNWSYYSCEPPSGCWKWNTGFLEKELLVTKSSCQLCQILEMGMMLGPFGLRDLLLTFVLFPGDRSRQNKIPTPLSSIDEFCLKNSTSTLQYW